MLFFYVGYFCIYKREEYFLFVDMKGSLKGEV